MGVVSCGIGGLVSLKAPFVFSSFFFVVFITAFLFVFFLFKKKEMSILGVADLEGHTDRVCTQSGHI